MAAGSDDGEWQFDPERYEAEHIARKALGFDILLARAPREVQMDDLAHALSRASRRQTSTTMADVKYIAKLPGVKHAPSGGLYVDRGMELPAELRPMPPPAPPREADPVLGRNAIGVVKRVTHDLERGSADGAPIADIKRVAAEHGVDERMFSAVLARLKNSGEVWMPRDGYLSLTSV